MPTLNKFNSFSEGLAEKVHNLASDALKVALTNTAPIAANSVLADITQITPGNGYVAGGTALTVTSSAQAGGTYTLSASNLSFTASGGSIGPFRYVVLYNDTPAGKPLIGYWDNGSSVTLAAAESFPVNFTGGAVLTIQ